MFLFFINDLPDYVHSLTVRLFADDCVLYRNIQNEADSKLPQEYMNNLLRWESDWQMEFHPSKCQLLHVVNKRKPSPTSYDIHGHKLEIVEAAKYVGVTFHKTINWNTH
jgi:hypothetical protein